MIEIPQKSDFQSLSQLISNTVGSCIDANEIALAEIANSSIRQSKLCLDGELEGAHFIYKTTEIEGLILVKEYWNMVSLFVSPKSQRKGIATILVDEALRVCREKPPKRMVALNSSSFASNFYKKYGFKPNGTPKVFPGGCIPYVHRF